MDESGLGGAGPGQQEPVHPEVLQNQNPETVVSVFQTGVLFLQSWGWYIVFGIVAILFIKSKFSPQLEQMRKRRQEQDYANFDAKTARSRQEAMEAARIRMQELHDAKAAKFAEEQKTKEEQKRLERIADWELHQRGGGYRSRVKAPEEASPGTSNGTGTSLKKKDKKPLRPNDFNPLMGDEGGGVCFRPPRRGGAGGG